MAASLVSSVARASAKPTSSRSGSATSPGSTRALRSSPGAASGGEGGLADRGPGGLGSGQRLQGAGVAVDQQVAGRDEAAEAFAVLTGRLAGGGAVGLLFALPRGGRGRAGALRGGEWGVQR